MTRLANAPALPKHPRMPPSIWARKYESGLPRDRNNMFQFHRLGDSNDQRAEYVMEAKAAWCNLIQSLAIPDIGYVCVLSIEQLGWSRFRVEQRPRDRSGMETTEAVNHLRALVGNCSPQTLELARAAAQRQRTKTTADMDNWTKQIIKDIKDADD